MSIETKRELELKFVVIFVKESINQTKNCGFS